MKHTPRISLEQWRALLAVVDSGGYAQAAGQLHKSQSAVTYAIQKMEALLGMRIFEIQGRKARLTPAGELLYRRATLLLEEASLLEQTAGNVSAGWEAEIRIAVETIFPDWLLFDCLKRLGAESPHTHVEVYESVLGGAPEALLSGQVSLAISPLVPPGFAAEPLLRTRFVAVAHPDHPLHALDRPLSQGDLRRHRHLLVRDTGSRRTAGTAFLQAAQRWTLSHLGTSIRATSLGHGYAWFPEDRIRDELASGLLKTLPLRGGVRYEQLYLIVAEPETAGPALRRLADIFRSVTDQETAAEKPPESAAPAKPAQEAPATRTKRSHKLGPSRRGA